MLFGHASPATGEICWNEDKSKLFYLKQHFDIPRSLKIEEFVEMVISLNSERFNEAQTDFFSNPVWFEKYQKIRHKRAVKLSGGERRWVCAMCALSVQANALFLAEPITAMDTLSRMHFWEHLAERVATNGLTVLVTSHHMD